MISKIIQQLRRFLHEEQNSSQYPRASLSEQQWTTLARQNIRTEQDLADLMTDEMLRKGVSQLLELSSEQQNQLIRELQALGLNTELQEPPPPFPSGVLIPDDVPSESDTAGDSDEQ